ncbi:MAG: hypothetical protein ACR2MD_16440 [Aridibacter sp.]
MHQECGKENDSGGVGGLNVRVPRVFSNAEKFESKLLNRITIADVATTMTTLRWRVSFSRFKTQLMEDDIFADWQRARTENFSYI